MNEVQNLLKALKERNKTELSKQPERLELSKLEDLKESFVKRAKKHFDDRDRVFSELNKISREVGELLREASKLRDEPDEIYREAKSVEKQIEDLGVTPPRGLDLIDGKQPNAWSNSIADTFILADDAANMLKG